MTLCCRSYQESSSKVTADGVVGLTRAFLAAGAQCTLVSLWPVPVAASKVFVHAFYTALLNGTKASAALADAMKTVQSSKQYSHPSNWAGKRCYSLKCEFYIVIIQKDDILMDLFCCFFFPIQDTCWLEMMSSSTVRLLSSAKLWQRFYSIQIERVML